jgi:hypothetical protein
MVVNFVAVVAVAGCTTPRDQPGDQPGGRSGDQPVASPSRAAPSPATSAARTPDTGAPVTVVPRRRASPDDVRGSTAWRTVRHLAGVVGPRHGTSPAYLEAARWVSTRFEELGYAVERQRFPVPGGDSWGVRVAAGRSVNVVAARGVDVRRPHLVVGAHLDTVPRAPGGEDNASGVGAMLAAAEAVAGRRTRLPVVFVAFGAEEPRGPGDDDHHFGSRAYVEALGPAERRGVRGMVSLDRVGVGTVLPVCSATESPGPLRAELLAAADRAGVATLPCVGNRASDHWSFVRNGLPGVRLGSTPYAEYHSPADVATVVDRAQLERAARTTVAWLSGG